VVFAGAGELELAILGKPSDALNHISMAAVHQHLSQDTVEVYGRSRVGIFLKGLE
jgi:hypothetical protein